MKMLKHLFNFYINASIHIGLVVYSLLKVTELYFNLPANDAFNYFAFFGTITGYNFVKYAAIAKLHHRSLTKSLRSIQVLSAISFLLGMYFSLKINFLTLLFCIPFGLLTVLYAVPFLNKFQHNLRSVAYLKNSIIAIVWAGITVLIPLIDAQKNIDLIAISSILQRFLIIMVLIIPFDIRDLPFDDVSLKTIPQLIGVKKAKKIGFVLLLFSLLLEFIIAPNSGFKNVFLFLSLAMLFLLMRASEKQSKYYSSFWVDALPVFWWLLLLGITNF